MEKIIVYALPVFGLMLLAEFAYGIATGRNTYRLNDVIANLSQGVMSQLTTLFTRIFQIGIYTLVYEGATLFRSDSFWNEWYGWLIGAVLVDFCGYWYHRHSHEKALLWAAHAVHHQSQDFNFTTALRQESAYPLFEWIYYLPLALIGLPPENFALTMLAVLLYQIWIHTEHVGKLGWFDLIFSSPSNHRVHHAVNDEYIDKNYGGMLIIWDRIFGTFTPETEQKCIYGTRPPLDSWDPIWADLVVYLGLFRDAWRTKSWVDRMRIWFMPPGWKPRDLPPAEKFDVSTIRTYDPKVAPAATWAGAIQFLLLVAASGALLWAMDELAFGTSAVLVAAICAGLWSTGALLAGRIGVGRALVVDSAAIVLALSVL